MAEDARSLSLSAKLDQLFKTVHPVGRGEYSFEEVARALEERGGPTVSATYIWQLRKGVRDNPTKKHLEALAGFFGVPPAYFFDDEQSFQIHDELEFLAALRMPRSSSWPSARRGSRQRCWRRRPTWSSAPREVDGVPEPKPGRSPHVRERTRRPVE